MYRFAYIGYEMVSYLYDLIFDMSYFKICFLTLNQVVLLDTKQLVAITIKFTLHIILTPSLLTDEI